MHAFLFLLDVSLAVIALVAVADKAMLAVLILTVVLFTYLLKLAIGEPRPNSCGDGMPSVHAAAIVAIATYVSVVGSTNPAALAAIAALALAILSIKLFYNEHSLPQVVVGGFVGLAFGAIFAGSATFSVGGASAVIV